MKNSAQAETDDTRSTEQGKTRNAIAKTAGVSHDTIKKVKDIRAGAIPEVQDMARPIATRRGHSVTLTKRGP